MNEVGAADCSRLLRSKKAELSGIVKSRKRKLRELFAICDNGSPIPQLDISNPDTPPINSAEAQFLEITDILQGRLFDESNLPARRKILSDFSNHKISSNKDSFDDGQRDESQKIEKLLIEDNTQRKKEVSATDIDDRSGDPVRDQIYIKNLKGPKKNLPASSSVEPIAKGTLTSTLDAIVTSRRKPSDVESTLEDITETQAEAQRRLPSASSDNQIPISTVRRHCVGQLPKALASQALKSHDLHRGNSKPQSSKTSQESSLSLSEKVNRQDEIINKDSVVSHSSIERGTENISSPSSNVDTYSAVTSIVQDASTDTSTEFEIRPDQNKINTENKKNPVPKIQEKISRQETLNFLQQDINSEAGVEPPFVETVTAKPHLMGDQNTRELSNDSSSDERGKDISKSNLKKNADGFLDYLDKSGDLASNLTLKNTAQSIHRVKGVALKKKNVIDGNYTGTEAQERIPRSDKAELKTVVVQDLNESIDTIEAASKKSSLLSEISPAKKSLLKSTFFSESQKTSPVVLSTPVTKSSSLEPRNTSIGPGSSGPDIASSIILDTQLNSGPSSGASAKPQLEIEKSLYHASQRINSQSPSTHIRISTQKQKENGRSKLSNVVFANKLVKINSRKPRDTNAQTETLKDDYFIPLFLANALANKGCIPTVETLLTTAHKTITTSNAYVPIHENQTAKVLKRIYHLQSSNKWSLRQPKRSVEPIRTKTHWDILLQEVAWMRTDFKEERKWKKTVARNMAAACAEWVSSDQYCRRSLQVKVSHRRIFSGIEENFPIDISNENYVDNDSIQEITKEVNMLEDFDEPQMSLLETVAPTDIFGLQDNDFVFGLQRSLTADKLLSELPMYGRPLKVPNIELQTSDNDPDRVWKRPALPLSKYVEGRMRLNLNSPPKKKSRFEYEEEDDEDQQTISSEKPTKPSPLPPESTDVALFDPKNKHILERIRNVNCFRPPSEFQMPQQTFFECRTASQWTWDEDKELKVLVRDYTYNWSLISSILTSKSKSELATGAERRTPWECFERWIELEGLPGDMQKTYYFRLYTSRIENANRNITAANSLQNSQGQIQQPRKKSTSSIRVERRRNQKHLILIDTMRKLAKKRETTIQKQQHAAGMAAMRKAQEVSHASNRNLSATTPQDFSRLRHEREEVMKERALYNQQRLEAQRRAAFAQRNSGASNQLQNGLSSVMRNAPVGASVTPISSNLNNQNRSHQTPTMPSHQISTGNIRVSGTVVNSMLQAPIQSQIPTSSSSPDLGLMSRAHAISQQQQAILRQQQQAQTYSQPSYSPRMNGISTPGYSAQGNLIPPFPTNSNGVITPSSNSLSPSGQSDSRQTTQPPQALTHVQRMEIQYKAKYPSATPDQITSMISQALSQSLQQHQRQNINKNSINAAAGPVASMNSMNGSQGTPQMYAQMLRHQQENQQKQPTNGALGDKFQSSLPGTSVNGNTGINNTNRASSGSLPTVN
ncbi:Chromatin modification-related protein eaf-1 [Golovinomyces cichoracearum]|uniref:Vacuolar import and degradation protein 21 n=1 Tax=Golovinomyces cichoracearum TaxID=62708 RepID=A0A420IYD2_9PEZI|nr:Chromatin modification-related protein eaf-1 [Golovinomyces cichoracearum]